MALPLLARWDAAWFINHLIKPSRSQIYLVEFWFLTDLVSAIGSKVNFCQHSGTVRNKHDALLTLLSSLLRHLRRLSLTPCWFELCSFCFQATNPIGFPVQGWWVSVDWQMTLTEHLSLALGLVHSSTLESLPQFPAPLRISWHLLLYSFPISKPQSLCMESDDFVYAGNCWGCTQTSLGQSYFV